MRRILLSVLLIFGLGVLVATPTLRDRSVAAVSIDVPRPALPPAVALVAAVVAASLLLLTMTIGRRSAGRGLYNPLGRSARDFRVVVAPWAPPDPLGC